MLEHDTSEESYFVHSMENMIQSEKDIAENINKTTTDLEDYVTPGKIMSVGLFLLLFFGTNFCMIQDIGGDPKLPLMLKIFFIMFAGCLGGGIISLGLSFGFYSLLRKIRHYFTPAQNLLSRLSFFQKAQKDQAILTNNFMNTERFRFYLLWSLQKQIAKIHTTYNSEFIEYLTKMKGSPFQLEQQLKEAYYHNQYREMWLLAKQIIGMGEFIQNTFEKFQELGVKDKAYLDTTFQKWVKEQQKNEKNTLQQAL